MRPPSADPPPPCCLLFVVQATASMRAGTCAAAPGSPPRPKIAVAEKLVQGTLRALLRQGAADRPHDVGVLAYHGNDQGETGLHAALPGTTPLEPFLPLADLAPKAGEAFTLGPFDAKGEAPPADTVAVAAGLVRAWAAEHPGAVRPLVVHITDGAGCDAALKRAENSLRALTVGGQHVHLINCVLSRAAMTSSVGEIVRRAYPGRQNAGARTAAAPSGGWRLEHREWWVQKGGNAPGEREDAHGIDPARGLAAVSDGAGSGIFSRLWANILTEALLGGGSAPGDSAALAGWLEGCRARWLKEINFPALRPTQQHRVRTAGAGATLLALRFAALPAAAGRPDLFAWSAWSVGDSCLFWVRDKQLLVTFPAVRSAEFGLCPPLLQTLADRPVLTPLSAGGIGKPGDLFLLATDATAQLLLNRCENEGEPDWDGVWNWDEAAWRDEVAELRRRGDMVDDDCTLMALRLVRGEDGVGRQGRPGRPTQLSSGAGGEPATE